MPGKNPRSLTAVTSLPGHLPARESRSDTAGLSMYSLRRLFQSGELDALDYPAFARDRFRITSVDVWSGGVSVRQADSTKRKQKPAHNTITRARDVGPGTLAFGRPGR